MGNCGLGGHMRFNKQVVKLVHYNGLVEEFYRPVRAGELLVDYPAHFICDATELLHPLDNFVGGTCLSEEDEMAIGEVYFLLPKRMLYEPPTEKDIAELIAKASMPRKESYKSSTLVPLPALPAKHGGYGHKDDEDNGDDEEEEDDHRAFVRRVLAEVKLELEKRAAADPLLERQLSNNAELKSAFASHMLARTCSRLWRPPLDTIDEDASNSLIV
ncbi:hypothetical protein KP509_26G065100 [Ceratopteris richardii]|uniref:Uncharacterized protein n=1 Tax=Ceratopteris richardii TaxID=49495 RepID=A0A8T2RNF6_CERRI|nr:hypothetical protein KP509_26G065100 [Ceratopteris richardii]